MRKKRLARQFFLSYFWVALVAVFLAAYLGSGAFREFYLQRTGEDLAARAKILVPQVRGHLDATIVAESDEEKADEPAAEDEYQELNSVIRSLGAAVATRFTVILPDGKVVADSDEDWRKMEPHSDRPEIIDAVQTRKIGQQTRWSATLKKELMYVAVPILADDAGDSAPVIAVVRASIPAATIQESLGWIRSRLIIGAGLTIGLIALVSLWTSLRIHRLVQSMADGASQFAGGRFEHRLSPTGFAEIDVLADSMNRMANDLNDRIETILRQQNELEAVLVSMQEGVLAVNNDGIVINLNQTCADLLAAAPDDVRGRLIHEVIRKSDLLNFVETTLTSEEPIEEDIRIRGDEERWLNAHGTRLHDAQGKQIGALVVLHDVTRLRRLENVRRDFVANVSHELKTPITSIKGFVETLLDGAIEDPENSTRFLEIVSRQVNRLEAIIEDLLTLSRLEKGPEEQLTRLERGRVRNVIQAAVEMCEKKAHNKEIEISVHCDPQLCAQMNSALLEQAMVNLIDNAVKYGPAGSHVDVTVEEENGRIALRVQDQGCGIEPKHLPRLFERFYRADKARSRELGGTGLGLAIVKHIALVHRGSVGVQSTVGRGSTFSILLPGTDQEA
jgi:two-component system phosphate regulon sensor histidine kinase PhoR